MMAGLRPVLITKCILGPRLHLGVRTRTESSIFMSGFFRLLLAFKGAQEGCAVKSPFGRLKPVREISGEEVVM